jgi:3-hydroxybutyryl-CoA dehydrogenase
MSKVVVVGAGTMGHGIAQVAAQSGHEVALFDIDDARVKAGVESVRKNLEKGVEKGKVTPADRDATMARLSGTTDLAKACAGSALAIEAAFEKMEVKQGIFRNLDEMCPKDAILASNTSSLSVAEIGRATKRPHAGCTSSTRSTS